MPSIEQSFYLLNTHTICVRKGCKESNNFQVLFVTEGTQLYATHAQLLEQLRPIALAETCNF